MKASNPLNLRPQDTLILIKLLCAESREWRQLDIAMELDMSQAEIANSLERLRRASLIDDSKRRVQRLAATEFIVHGIKYFYPPELGAYSRGMPTGHSAKPLKGKLVIEENLEWVWPDAEGKDRGLILHPIYESVPFAAQQDPELYELMALIDSIRAGGPREKKMAEEHLRKRLMSSRDRKIAHEA